MQSRGLYILIRSCQNIPSCSINCVMLTAATWWNILANWPNIIKAMSAVLKSPTSIQLIFTGLYVYLVLINKLFVLFILFNLPKLVNKPKSVKKRVSKVRACWCIIQGVIRFEILPLFWEQDHIDKTSRWDRIAHGLHSYLVMFITVYKPWLSSRLYSKTPY